MNHRAASSFLRLLACGLTTLVSLTLVSPPSAHGQQNWRWVNSLPASVGWKDAAYGNGVYVVVGGDATIASSTDAITWTIRRMSTANMALNAVTFADGKFVAVGMGTPSSLSAGLIMTSTDGTNWTINDSFASANNAQLFDIVQAGGTWVASASSSSGAMFVSSDAQTWRRVGLPNFAIANTGCYGAGRFVFGANSNAVVTSTDGNTWTRTAVTTETNASVSSVAFAGGKFVAVGRDASFNAATWSSTDAVTWTQAPTLPAASGSAGLISIATNGTGFVAGGSATQFYSSADGSAWTQRTPAFPNSSRQLGSLPDPFSGVVFANNLYLALGNYGTISTSADGATWTRRSSGTVSDLGTIIHDGSRYIVSGAGGTILTSTDANTWTQLTTDTNNDLTRMATSGSRFVAVGFNGINHSANLTSWTQVAGTSFDRFAAVAYGNNRFVAAYTGTLLGVRTSTDGITWAAAVGIPNSGGTTNHLIFANGLFVIAMGGVGSTPPKIYTSPDGTAWTERSPAGLTSSVGMESLAYGGGRFVILTNGPRSITSTDGITWTVNSLSTSYTLRSVSYLGTQFIANSSLYGAQPYASTDGVNWSALSNVVTTNLVSTNFIAVGNTVVAVGPQGSILRGDRVTGPVVSTAGRIANMSIRTNAGTGDNTLIVGVGLGGSGTSGNKAVLIRGNGPSLTGYGVTGALADPVMTVFSGSTLVAQNDDWGGGFDFASVGAYAYGAGTVRDSAIYSAATPSGTYSIQIVGKNNTTGVTLAEVYDATPAASFFVTTPRLINVSARTTVGTGDNILIVGVGTTGSTPVRMLFRATGPTLSDYGVTGVLADPKLELYNGATKLAENDNWAGTAELKAAFASVAAFSFASDTSRDAALVITLPPGATYTVQVSGVSASTGVALVEAYQLP